MAYYGIDEGATLHLRIVTRRGMFINVCLMTGDVVMLDVELGNTIHQVKALIQAEIGFHPSQQKLFLKDLELKDWSTLADYKVKEYDTLYLLFAGSRNHPIFVKSSTGQNISLDTESSDLVKGVKIQIFEKEGIPIDQQCLLFNRKQLEDGKELAHYNIHRDCLLHLVVRLKGGGDFGFKFNSLNNSEEQEFSDTAPPYRLVDFGISFKSKCLNPDCSAFHEEIIVNKKFVTKLNIAKASMELICPICKKQAERSTNCGFFMAKYTFVGCPKGGAIKTIEGIAKTYAYKKFKQGDNIEWEFLEVTVEELNNG